MQGQNAVESITSATTGKITTILAMPLKIEGKIAGVLFAGINNEVLSAHTVAKSKFGEKGSIYAYGPHGRILLHKDVAAMGRDDSANPTAQYILKTKNGTITYFSPLGEEKTIYFKELPSIGWILCLEFDRGEIYQPLYDMPELYTFSNVGKNFATPGGDIEILKDISLVVEEGEMLAIVGASGSGKSTLLHLMGALDNPTTGEVCFEGRNMALMGEAQKAAFRNKTLGFVFQFHHLLPEFSALENVAMGDLRIAYGVPLVQDYDKESSLLTAAHKRKDEFSTLAAGMLLCFLATLYPARQASRLQPAEALRYE